MADGRAAGHTIAALQVASVAAYADDEQPPGLQALDELRNGRNDRDPVRNRFFLKGKRFELAPSLGIVPNNPFARRFTVGAELGYHFSEQLAVFGVFSFAPDLGQRDVKSLTDVLLQRADDDAFAQPFDKVTLGAAFGVQYAPILGVGLVTQTEFLATKNPEYDPANPAESNFSDLSKGATQVHPSFIPGLGLNFFLTQSISLKLDGRFQIYLDDKPTYDTANPPTGIRAGPLFNASVGIGIYLPRMKPRLSDF